MLVINQEEVCMSTESARKFIEDLDNNTGLSTQFSIASPNTFDGVIDFAYGKGYVFTKDELEAAIKRAPNSRIAHQLKQYAH